HRFEPHRPPSAFPFHTCVERERSFSGTRRQPWWKRCRFHHGSGCSRGWDHDRARGFGSTQPQRLWLVRTDTRSAAVGEEFSRSPTCSLVPRKGSSVGTRCRESWPGRSKMTESQEAAATASAYLSKQRPR